MLRLGLRHQRRLPARGTGRAGPKAVGQRQAQGGAGRLATGHQRVERAVLGAFERRRRVASEPPVITQREQVHDLVADGGAGAKPLVATRTPEDRKRQVLDGKVGVRRVGAVHPALQGSVVCSVDSGHGM
ncbi:hypothetical protein AVHM3334_05380 [Acidovorax sp. SUPP3334]|nr:hypothetical protein AVHM3334_05380 [Acidovorax sp. SUPP3334]